MTILGWKSPTSTDVINCCCVTCNMKNLGLARFRVFFSSPFLELDYINHLQLTASVGWAKHFHNIYRSSFALQEWVEFIDKKLRSSELSIWKRAVGVKNPVFTIQRLWHQGWRSRWKKTEKEVMKRKKRNLIIDDLLFCKHCRRLLIIKV